MTPKIDALVCEARRRLDDFVYWFDLMAGEGIGFGIATVDLSAALLDLAAALRGPAPFGSPMGAYELPKPGEKSRPKNRRKLSLKDPTAWPEAFVGEGPDEFARRDRSAENLEARRDTQTEDWNAFVDLLAPKSEQ